MPDLPTHTRPDVTTRAPTPAVSAAAKITIGGHSGDASEALRGVRSDEPKLRIVALGALARLGRLDPALLIAALTDRHRTVRRRAIELCARERTLDPEIDSLLLGMMSGDDNDLVETAAWALGERHGSERRGTEPDGAGASGDLKTTIVERLVQVAVSHPDPLCREAAVAGLGSIGDVSGRVGVLAATKDRATVRRRAAVALAAFEGTEIDDALNRLRTDRDWQVRQTAEDLLRLGPSATDERP